MTTTRIVRRTSAFGAFFAILALMTGGISVFADGGTYDVQVADKTGYAAQQTTDDAIVEYIGDSNISFGSAGTGTFGTFLQIQNNLRNGDTTPTGRRKATPAAAPPSITPCW